MKKIIIIEGYLAAGKSTFALKLSKKVGVPYLSKDSFKTALCKNIRIRNREESSMYSMITFEGILYVTEKMMEREYPIIIEGNFTPRGVKKIDESDCIRRLIDKYQYESLTFKFWGKTSVLYKRFVERENTVERGEANKMKEEFSYKDFDEWCHNLDTFDVGGKTIKINTTNFGNVNYSVYLDMSKNFFSEFTVFQRTWI